jgi:hypothetical protein
MCCYASPHHNTAPTKRTSHFSRTTLDHMLRE